MRTPPPPRVGQSPEGGGLRLHILQHSLGVDQFGRGERYRNHFVTGEGSTDWPHCKALVDAGLMVLRGASALSGDMDLFQVTPEGRQFVTDNSPAPPKRTRSQQRYQRYLDADTGLSFRDWLDCERTIA